MTKKSTSNTSKKALSNENLNGDVSFVHGLSSSRDAKHKTLIEAVRKSSHPSGYASTAIMKSETVYVISQQSNGQQKIKKKVRKILNTSSTNNSLNETHHTQHDSTTFSQHTTNPKIEYYDDEDNNFDDSSTKRHHHRHKANSQSRNQSYDCQQHANKHRHADDADDFEDVSTDDEDVNTVKVAPSKSAYHKKSIKNSTQSFSKSNVNSSYSKQQQQQFSHQQSTRMTTLTGTSAGFCGSSFLTSQPNLEMSTYSTNNLSNLNSRTKPKTSREILQEIARLTNGTTPTLKSNKGGVGISAMLSHHYGCLDNMSDAECSLSSNSRVINPNFKSKSKTNKK